VNPADDPTRGASRRRRSPLREPRVTSASRPAIGSPDSRPAIGSPDSVNAMYAISSRLGPGVSSPDRHHGEASGAQGDRTTGSHRRCGCSPDALPIPETRSSRVRLPLIPGSPQPRSPASPVSAESSPRTVSAHLHPPTWSCPRRSTQHPPPRRVPPDPTGSCDCQRIADHHLTPATFPEPVPFHVKRRRTQSSTRCTQPPGATPAHHP
jgi:hypothetical protein